MSSSIESTASARRVSPLRGVLQAAGWAPGSVAGVELSGGGAGPLGLADLSTCDRIGVKGRGAVAWLGAMGVALPSQPNRLLERPDGLTVARLSDSEFVLADFAGPTSATVQGLRAALEGARPEGCYDVPRAESQAVFGLAGPWLTAALAALCPADLRAAAFPPAGVLQTQCAGVGAQLWNLSRTGLDRAVLSCDASLAAHVWSALLASVVAAGGHTAPQSSWFSAR